MKITRSAWIVSESDGIKAIVFNVQDRKRQKGELVSVSVRLVNDKYVELIVYLKFVENGHHLRSTSIYRTSKCDREFFAILDDLLDELGIEERFE